MGNNDLEQYVGSSHVKEQQHILEQTKSNKEEKTTYKLQIDITNPIKQKQKTKEKKM